MRIGYAIIFTALIVSACGESDRSEIYNENNTSVVNGIVYNINEKPINGLYRTYYANGNLKMEVDSREGLPNGVGKFYDEEGNLMFQGVFANGKLDGPMYQYYPDGSVHNEMNYSGGVYDGTQKVYDKNGEQTVEIVYDHGKPVSGVVMFGKTKLELSEDELNSLAASLYEDKETEQKEESSAKK